MARKNKKQNFKAEIPAATNTQDLKHIPQFIKSITNSVISKEQEALIARDNELREQVLASLEPCKEAEEQAKRLVSEYDAKNSQLEEQLAAIEVQKNKLETEKKTLSSSKELLNLESVQLQEARQKIFNETKALKIQQLEVQQQLSLLHERQLNAELGFANEKRDALQEKDTELRLLHEASLSQIEERLKNISAKDKQLYEREEELKVKEEEAELGFARTQQEQLEWLRSEKLKNRVILQADTLKLEAQKVALDAWQIQIDEEKEKLGIQKEVLKQHIYQQFEAQLIRLQTENKSLSTSKQKAIDEIENIAQKLSQYEDLKRQLSSQSIEHIQEEIDRLRQENRELKHTLSERYEDGLIEDNERLEDTLAKIKDNFYDLEGRYAETQAELHNARLSALEKQNLLQEKRILEEHKRVLDISIEHLKSQVDDLEASQKGELPFALLSAMDKEFNFPASGLQVVPDLDSFTNKMHQHIAGQGFYYTLKDIRLFIAGLSMSKLHILQGISGTGKTSLARTFARAINNVTGDNQELYCEIIRVQAGWRDREDLLGHYNAFEKRFYAKEALQALYRAQQPRFKDTLQIILLDEMNLSQPEQYFADFLSLLETPDIAKINLLDSPNSKAPSMFVNDGRALKIPDNVWFIGTANHDETTKEFADKTYDRAHIMEVHRSDQNFNDDIGHASQYSYSSLMKRFDESIDKHKDDVDEMFELLLASDLQNELRKINVSWGNRLQSQAQKFIPVYMECGGSASEAFDHLLATKVFRPGKVVGRYDTRHEKIEDIAESLLNIWDTLNLDGSPEASSSLLEQDIERLKGE